MTSPITRLETFIIEQENLLEFIEQNPLTVHDTLINLLETLKEYEKDVIDAAYETGYHMDSKACVEQNIKEYGWE